LHPNNPDKMKVAVNVTITVESIDKKLEQIVKEGGEVYM
jgi:predicted enzyme related to lactoylglutathione lyase